MKNKVYSNEMLYQKKFNIKYLGGLILILLGGIIYLLFFTEKYDVLEAKGYISCDDACVISVITGVDYYITIKDAKKIYIGSEEINVKKVLVKEVNTDWESYQSYRTVELELSKKVSFNDEIISLNILSNKKTLISKLNPFKKGG